MSVLPVSSPTASICDTIAGKCLLFCSSTNNRLPAYEQLGVHGDDGAGVEPEGVVRAVGPGASATPRSARAQKHRLLSMEFKRFVNTIIQMPCQIVAVADGWCTGCCRGTNGKEYFSELFMHCNVEST